MNEPNKDEDQKLVKLGDIENDELLSYKKKNSIKNVIIFISFALIICLVILIIFLILKDKKNNGDKEENNNACQPNYYLVNGNCKPYSFRATYRKFEANEQIQLFNNAFLLNINGMYMNNSEITKMSSYNFSTIGNHTIYFDMDISSLDSLTKMFYEIVKMVSIYFTPSFNTKNIIAMDYMFHNCNNLTSINLSNFNTSKVKTLFSMFGECGSLKSLNLSNFDTSSVTDMGSLFSQCISLVSVDISKFNTSSVINMNRMFL